MVDDPAKERSTADTPDQIGKNPVAHAIIRIGLRARDRLVALLFPLFCGLQPRFERIDSRIFADWVSCIWFITHAMLLVTGTGDMCNDRLPRAPLH